MENITYKELEIGQSISRKRIITQHDIMQSANLFQDHNPAHLCDEFAAKSMFKNRIAHGMLGAGLISGVIGEELPGPGTIYLSQNLQFKAPVYIGDEITVDVLVTEKKDGKVKDSGTVILNTVCTNQNGIVVMEGQAKVLAPSEKIKYEGKVNWGDPEL